MSTIYSFYILIVTLELQSKNIQTVHNEIIVGHLADNRALLVKFNSYFDNAKEDLDKEIYISLCMNFHNGIEDSHLKASGYVKNTDEKTIIKYKPKTWNFMSKDRSNIDRNSAKYNCTQSCLKVISLKSFISDDHGNMNFLSFQVAILSTYYKLKSPKLISNSEFGLLNNSNETISSARQLYCDDNGHWDINDTLVEHDVCEIT
ncbi:hypothetical protein BpHYR1_024039 [Brachionus plicatilis]|uniref:Uncharacterized protein n=1 Tax=Brachionus plicatilis TaxID=10195 RepID=A0A3M7SIR3_BRAPC|nr:hypothetical protein BpHYR1_024039 [Brachionus plicatilis]